MRIRNTAFTSPNGKSQLMQPKIRLPDTYRLPFRNLLAHGDLFLLLADLFHQQHLLLRRDQQRVRVHPAVKIKGLTGKAW
jgi:hypothetical protein